MLAYTACALLAGIVALVEIVSRYRDAPAEVLKEWPAWVYIAVNAAAGIAAFWLIGEFGWPPSTDVGGDVQGTEVVLRVLAASFGSLAAIRSAFFQARVGDHLVDVGPHFLLKSLLDAADRSMDRRRATRRSAVVSEIMGGVDFERAKVALPVHCFTAMQNVADEEQQQVSAELTRIATLHNMPPKAKSLYLGFLLLNIVGVDLLRQAVLDLGLSSDPSPVD